MSNASAKAQELKKQPIIDTKLIGKLAITVTLLYFFLVGVTALSGGLKMLGSGFAKTLFDLGEMPFVGLMAGMLATVLFQSSSVTTSIIVGLVSAGSVSITGAIPMIMGANIGTSVTNTLVSLGYMNDTKSFKRAFAAATVHDFFNLISVTILLPLELAFGFIQKISIWLTSMVYGNYAGVKYSSPIKAMIKPPVKAIKATLLDIFPNIAAFIMIGIAGVLIIASLTLIVKNMKTLITSNQDSVINKLLSKNPLMSIVFGALVTISVQSSSITTSLLVPMAGAGVLSLNSIFPVTLGANIGTTATAMLAAMTGNAAGLTIAFVHLVFNVIGTLMIFPSKRIRQVPLWCATKLSELVEKSKFYGLLYVAMVFFIIPLTLVLLNK